MKKGMIIVAAAMACAMGAPAASFTNLNFEVYTPDSEGGGADVPGWGYLAFDPQPMEGATFGLITTNNEYLAPLEGEISLFLVMGVVMYPPFEMSMSQTGEVPTNATHIRFLTTWQGVDATLGGTSLVASSPEVVLPGVYRYTTDIHSLAGQTADLSFTLHWSSERERHGLDQIEFLNGEEVVWPLPSPYGPTARCLEDFHAGTLNTSRWEVATAGQEISYSTTNGDLRTRIGFGADTAANETTFRFRPLIRGDWDVLMDFRTYQVTGTGTGTVGMALGADFGPDGAAQAGVGRMADIHALEPRYMVDWGAGPTGEVSNASVSGIFRLIRAGEEVTGLIWSTESNRWQTIGTAGGYTDESARIGIKVWNTGMLGPKGAFQTQADNLMLVDGKVSLEGMAIKMFGLNESGAPTMTWDSAEIAESNRYFVTRSTNLLDPVWNRISGGIMDSGIETNWTDSNPGSGPFYYRIEAAPK